MTVRIADLLPRLVRDDEQHAVESERMTDAYRSYEMTHMDGVERSAQDAGSCCVTVAIVARTSSLRTNL